MIRRFCWSMLLLSSCATAHWQHDITAALSSARAAGQELVVYFALHGREASDRMQSALTDPVVLDALADGGFQAVIADGASRDRLYQQWVGGGEGMGIAVLDRGGKVYAARPGPQDPPELAAFVRMCAAARSELADARAAAARDGGPRDKHRLGCILLQLGCRTECEPLLLDAAFAGIDDARHRLARLYALDGDLGAARRWLKIGPKTAAGLVTEGYVLFKERRHQESIAAFDAALKSADIGIERQRALLYLGKALHENNQDLLAVPMLEALAAEGSGSTFEAAARHTLGHINDPQHGHTH